MCSSNSTGDDSGLSSSYDIVTEDFRAISGTLPHFEVLEKNMVGVEAKPLKKANKPYKIRREGSFVNGFRWSWGFVDEQDNIRNNL